MAKEPQTTAEQLAEVKRAFWAVYEPPILRFLDWMAAFLERHPIPRWFERAMTPLDWLNRQIARAWRALG